MPSLRNIIILAAMPVLLLACKKGSIETNYNSNLKVASDHVLFEQAYSKVFNIFYRVVSDSILPYTGTRSIFSASCTYTDDPVITYNVNYGPSFRLCPDHIFRKGSFTAILDKAFNKNGARASLTFNGYEFIDSQGDTILLAGENQIINLGYSVSEFQSYEHIVLSNTIFVKDSLDTLQSFWNAYRYIEKTAGQQSPADFNDDVFTMTGDSHGSGTNGVVFSSNIQDSIWDYTYCRWLRKGSITLSTPGLDIKTGSIEFIGQDTCINRVKYIFNGNDFYEDL